MNKDMPKVANKKTLLIIGLIFSALFSNSSWAETFKVINFNVWGLPVPIVWDANARYQELMKQLRENSADFVLLSEVFSPKAKIQLRSSDYPYEAQGMRSRGRLMGSGLRILSKHPILRKAILGYGVCKKDDCLARKGALLAVVKLPSGQKLNLLNTHLNARGGDLIRQEQIEQMNEFLQYFAEPDAPIILAGDFNASPGSGTYQKVLNSWPVVDVWASLNGMDGGYTYDTRTNHYARDYSARTGFPDQWDRIDFQFATRELKPLSSEVTFNKPPLLSDHYGVVAEYQVVSKVQQRE